MEHSSRNLDGSHLLLLDSIINIKRAGINSNTIENKIDSFIKREFHNNCLSTGTLREVYIKQYLFCNDLYIYINKLRDTLIDNIEEDEEVKVKKIINFQIIADYFLAKNRSYQDRISKL